MSSSSFPKTSKGNFRLHEKVDYIENIPVGTLCRMDDSTIVAVGNPGPDEYCEDVRDGFFLYRSTDNGQTWTHIDWNAQGRSVQPAPTGALTCTDQGTLVLAFADLSEKHMTWDDERKDAPGAILPTVVMRSTDSGDSWTDVQRLHPDWTGATRDMLITGDGRIVFTTMKMLSGPGRHSCLTYMSPDDGLTWQPSNIIDLGGNGHHDGAIEATIVEATDGKLIKYIRTMWGVFWLAESTDGGKYWHPFGPTTIPASSAPGILKRLASGRIILAWNLPYPEGSTDPADVRGGDRIWSAVPASNYRKQLSICFSDDDCNTWSAPIAIAESDREITYPQVFEPTPGKLWITAHRWNFRVELLEEDFLGR